jgi:hypothetical protein
MPPQKMLRNEISKTKLMLVEGADAKFFCIWALEAYEINDVQVMDFGGITELYGYLKMLSVLPDYEKVKSIVIVRDAEGKPNTAVISIKKALKENSLPVPAKPFEFTHNNPRVAFMLFPGFDGIRNLVPGTLEDLCVAIIKDADVKRLDCVTAYLSCLENEGKNITWRHKSFLHAYFSGENRFVGMKIGEASRAGAWNWENEQLKPFKEIVKTM